MEIVSDTGAEIGIRPAFEKPMRATGEVTTFTLTPVGTTSTEVAWRMRGIRTGVLAVLGEVVPMDNFRAEDFDKGPARLRAVAESGACARIRLPAWQQQRNGSRVRGRVPCRTLSPR